MKICMKQYQKLAMRTSPWDGHDKIDNGVLGLMGEAGELVDVYKKWMYQSGANPPLPRAKLADELGDVMWYLAELADGLNMHLIDMVGKDFAELDRRAQVKVRQVKTPLRSMITGLLGRAYSLNRTVGRSDWRAVNGHVQRIMISMSYIACIAGTTLADVAEGNIDKLKKRYPNGFDAETSMRRYE